MPAAARATCADHNDGVYRVARCAGQLVFARMDDFAHHPYAGKYQRQRGVRGRVPFWTRKLEPAAKRKTACPNYAWAGCSFDGMCKHPTHEWERYGRRLLPPGGPRISVRRTALCRFSALSRCASGCTGAEPDGAEVCTGTCADVGACDSVCPWMGSHRDASSRACAAIKHCCCICASNASARPSPSVPVGGAGAVASRDEGARCGL